MSDIVRFDPQTGLPLMDSDFVRVVRCKDCKYYEIAWLTKSGEYDKRCKPSICIKGEYAVRRNEDWYCADGERKDDE